jgi:hypothetical protein
MGTVVEMLAEKTYQHGHAIGRKEADELGNYSPIVRGGWRRGGDYRTPG